MRRAPQVCAVLLAFAAAASAQVPSGPAPVVAPPETLTAVLFGPADLPAPAMSVQAPDTLRFGAPLRVTLDFGAAAAPPADSLGVSVPWLHIRGAATGPADGRLELELRCWRAGPWRLAWADPDHAGPVLETAGRLPADASPAPVRDPRRPGRDLMRIALAALLAAVLAGALIAAWLRRRRGPPERTSDDPPPAWALFALSLAPAVDAGEPRAGETGAYLTRVGRALREYVARRYGVAAAGLTGGDVAGAVAARQYEAARVAGFDALLGECDRLRFDPVPPAPEVCRRLTAAALGAVARDRDGGAGADAAAAAAWSRLRRSCRDWTGADPTEAVEEATHA